MSDHLSKTNSKFNWKTVSEVMDNQKTVVITDNKGTRHQGKILRSDHRATCVTINQDENKLIFNRNIVAFEVLEK